MLNASDDARAGIPVAREPYPEGEKGIRKSLEVVCRKVREGAPTAVMRSFAGNVLRQAGFPRTTRQKATAFLDYVRTHVGYVPDPLGTETIQTAAVSLCVEGAPVCIPIGDCDDLVTAVATLCAAAGEEVEVVRQYFGPGKQQHVLCEVRTEDNRWFPLDPSSMTMPAGSKAEAVSETRCSPWDEKATGLSGDAELVGIGALPVFVLTRQGWQRAPDTVTLGAVDVEAAWWYRAGEAEMALPVVKPHPGFGQAEGAMPLTYNTADKQGGGGRLSTGTALAAGAAIVLVAGVVAAVVRRSL